MTTPNRAPWPRPSAKNIRGLGDVVAMAAQPIAKAADRILGTDLENCGGCKERREWLNRMAPFPKR